MTVMDIDHQAIIVRAWSAPETTSVELPPVRVNEILTARYDVQPPYRYSGADLWDMETRKAAAPDKFIPTVVRPGSAEKFPSTRRGSIEEFTRISDQRLWADPEQFV